MRRYRSAVSTFVQLDLLDVRRAQLIDATFLVETLHDSDYRQSIVVSAFGRGLQLVDRPSASKDSSRHVGREPLRRR